jgi:hypothetical protein
MHINKKDAEREYVTFFIIIIFFHETDAESEYMILTLDVSDGIDKEFCKFKSNRGQGVQINSYSVLLITMFYFMFFLFLFFLFLLLLPSVCARETLEGREGTREK